MLSTNTDFEGARTSCGLSGTDLRMWTALNFGGGRWEGRKETTTKKDKCACGSVRVLDLYFFICNTSFIISLSWHQTHKAVGGNCSDVKWKATDMIVRQQFLWVDKAAQRQALQNRRKIQALEAFLA